MVKESEKAFRGYHPGLHSQPLAGRPELRGSSADPHAGLPLVLEQHYSDVKGVEHQRLTEQRRLAAEVRSFERDLAHAAQERSELRRQIPQVAEYVARIEVALRALEQLTVATSTLQLEGSTPATHSAVLAAHIAVTGGSPTMIVGADAMQGGAPAVSGSATAGESLRLWRPLFVSPAVVLATVWLATAFGWIESELAGIALVPATLGSLLAHVFGTLESAHVRWLWVHFALLVCPWLGSWTVHRFALGDWIVALLLSLVVAPLMAFGFTKLLKLRERLRVQQRVELSRLAPSLFIASLSVAGVVRRLLQPYSFHCILLILIAADYDDACVPGVVFDDQRAWLCSFRAPVPRSQKQRVCWSRVWPGHPSIACVARIRSVGHHPQPTTPGGVPAARTNCKAAA
jgi:hypothetical protein